MKNYYHSVLSVFLLITAISFYSCKDEISGIQRNHYSDEALYRMAMTDAMTADENEISNSLIPLVESNTYLIFKVINNIKYVLVGSVMPKKYISSYPKDSSVVLKYGDMWVTVVPEFKDWFIKHPNQISNSRLYAQKLLGLPKNEIDTFYITEVWAKLSDIFRPSPDSTTSTKTVGIFFPNNVDAGYRAWFNNNLIFSYYPDAGKIQYTWTRLGYTYNWGDPANEVGLSEFIIKKNSTVLIKDVIKVEDYVK